MEVAEGPIETDRPRLTTLSCCMEFLYLFPTPSTSTHSSSFPSSLLYLYADFIGDRYSSPRPGPVGTVCSSSGNSTMFLGSGGKWGKEVEKKWSVSGEFGRGKLFLSCWPIKYWNQMAGARTDGRTVGANRSSLV